MVKLLTFLAMLSPVILRAGLSDAIQHLYPSAVSLVDYVVSESGSVQMITFWNTNSLGPTPSQAQFNAAESNLLFSVTLQPASSQMAANGRKLVGADLAFRLNSITNIQTGQSGWSTWWTNATFYSDITNQMTLAKSLGLDSVRLNWSIDTIITNAASRSNYNFRHNFYLDMAASNGLKVVVAPGAFDQWVGCGTNIVAWTNQVEYLFSNMGSRITNVIGLLVMVEANGVYGFSTNTVAVSDTTNAIGIMIAQGRRLLPNGSVSTSVSISAVADLTSSLNTPFYNLGDRIELDLYYNARVSEISAAIVDQYPSKLIFIGEFGADRSLSTNAQIARFNAIRDIHSMPNVVGSQVWTFKDQILDQGTNALQNWGLFNEDSTPRVQITAILQSFSHTYDGAVFSASLEATAMGVGTTYVNPTNFYFSAYVSRPSLAHVSASTDILGAALNCDPTLDIYITNPAGVDEYLFAKGTFSAIGNQGTPSNQKFVKMYPGLWKFRGRMKTVTTGTANFYGGTGFSVKIIPGKDY